MGASAAHREAFVSCGILRHPIDLRPIGGGAMALKNRSAENMGQFLSVTFRPRVVVPNPSTLLPMIVWKALRAACLCGGLLGGVLLCPIRVEADFSTAPT